MVLMSEESMNEKPIQRKRFRALDLFCGGGAVHAARKRLAFRSLVLLTRLGLGVTPHIVFPRESQVISC